MAALGVIGLLAFIAGVLMFIVNVIRKKQKRIWGIVAGIGFVCFIIGVSLSGPSAPTTSPSSVPQAIPSSVPKTTPAELPEDFKASCTSVEYDDLARNTETYVGQHIHYQGDVVQVREMGNDRYVLRVNVTKDEYDLWRDTIWVNYTGSRTLERDIIQLWGTVKGRREYTAVLGNQIVIPEIDAKYLEIDVKAANRR
jgi:hypothetical protein